MEDLVHSAKVCRDCHVIPISSQLTKREHDDIMVALERRGGFWDYKFLVDGEPIEIQCRHRRQSDENGIVFCVGCGEETGEVIYLRW